MALVDVTKKMERGWEDEEIIQITKCVCGSTEDFMVGIDQGDPNECPKCGRKFVCVQTTKVYEVTD